MKALALAAALMCGAAAAVVSPGPADARGCIKGAIVGGVAGHFVHHGWLGAAAGCFVGHHMANRHRSYDNYNQNTGYYRNR